MLDGPYEPLADPDERRLAIQLALGRIFRMLRGVIPYDAADYERCVSIIMTNSPPVEDKSPSYVRTHGPLYTHPGASVGPGKW